MTMFEISWNGERLQTPATTLQALLLARGHGLDGAFACAINKAFVPRSQWAERALQNGDCIDVISPIQGG